MLFTSSPPSCTSRSQRHADGDRIARRRLEACALAREGRARLADRVAIRLHHGDCFSRLAGEVLAVAVERRECALLEVRDAAQRRLES
jgi:hypothetical protein